MSAKYIIRLDDASEFMDYSKWDPFFELFSKYDLKPLIAIIPFNKDPELMKGCRDELFWDKVREWQLKKYLIGMHGYEHVYSVRKRGIIGLNKFSEFAGIPLDKQINMLSKAYRKFLDEGIKTEIFIAPAHSFDTNTIIAIKEATDIKYISDGFFVNPILNYDLKWIPQQLWRPVKKRRGVWTVCYHPETSDNESVRVLDIFLKENINHFTDPLTLEFNSIGLEDIVFSIAMKIFVRFRYSEFIKNI